MHGIDCPCLNLNSRRPGADKEASPVVYHSPNSPLPLPSLYFIPMQATFDNKINLLSAHIRSSVDDSILYSISTTHNLWGRTVTLLKDANPAPGSSPIVGAIYWRERLFMVHGHRKPIDDIKRKTPGFVLDAKPTRNGQHRRTQSQVSKKEDVKAPSRKLKGTNDKTEGQDRDSKRKRSKSVTIASPPIIASPLQQSFVPLARNPSVFLNKVGLGNWWRSMSCITRYWRWASDRTEYEMTYHHEHWKVCYASPRSHHPILSASPSIHLFLSITTPTSPFLSFILLILLSCLGPDYFGSRKKTSFSPREEHHSSQNSHPVFYH